ncbi:MAG TPA: HEAT repeat domain-containing protein [Thermosynechococcaceae cyanobacterium]
MKYLADYIKAIEGMASPCEIVDSNFKSEQKFVGTGSTNVTRRVHYFADGVSVASSKHEHRRTFDGESRVSHEEFWYTYKVVNDNGFVFKGDMTKILEGNWADIAPGAHPLSEQIEALPATVPLSILKTRAQSHEHYVVLKTRAQSDDDSAVRMIAVQELARGWKDDPETLSILKTRAQSDENYAVRSTAVQELARAWKDEPGMFEFLTDRALHDPFERGNNWQDNPRQAALEAVVKNYPADPKTLELLHRALHDLDEDVRSFAKQQLAKLK